MFGGCCYGTMNAALFFSHHGLFSLAPCLPAVKHFLRKFHKHFCKEFFLSRLKSKNLCCGPFERAGLLASGGKGGSETPPPPGGSGEWSGTPPPSWHLGGKIFGAADFFPLRPTAPNFFGFPDIRDREEGGWSRPRPPDPRGVRTLLYSLHLFSLA